LRVRFMESPDDSDAVHWGFEPVGRVTPCAPQFGNAQTARRGLTRPTFRFTESPHGLNAARWDPELRASPWRRLSSLRVHGTFLSRASVSGDWEVARTGRQECLPYTI